MTGEEERRRLTNKDRSRVIEENMKNLDSVFEEEGEEKGSNYSSSEESVKSN